MAADFFTDLTDVYEAMIDWPKRLANEEPFYRRLFARLAAQRVLDAACGTGRHAAMFHGWSLRVEGADVSPAMIARARGLFGEPEGLRWVVRGFDQPVETQEPFDAAICVGNSLSLAPDMVAVRAAIHELLAAVRPGGILVVQALNLWRLADGFCLWQKCQRATLTAGEFLILKGVHRGGPRGFVDLVLTESPGGSLKHSESVAFLGLEATELGQMALQSGAKQIEFFGSYQGDPYNRQESPDLIMVAEE
jgi:glycine/sarcosine N-methyltransferase